MAAMAQDAGGKALGGERRKLAPLKDGRLEPLSQKPIILWAIMFTVFVRQPRWRAVDRREMGRVRKWKDEQWAEDRWHQSIV